MEQRGIITPPVRPYPNQSLDTTTGPFHESVDYVDYSEGESDSPHEETPKSAFFIPDSIQISIPDALDPSPASKSPGSSDHEIPVHDETPLSSPTSNRRTRIVRFRSRVRITSGIRRQRPKDFPSEYHIPGNDVKSLNADSSLSSSPSSSISAPLRSRSDDESNDRGWGPLGQRVALLAYNSPKRRTRNAREANSKRQTERQFQAHNVNERTPLVHPPRPRVYDGAAGDQPRFASESDRDEESRLSREIDMVFGKWPERLLNYKVCPTDTGLI